MVFLLEKICQSVKNTLNKILKKIPFLEENILKFLIKKSNLDSDFNLVTFEKIFK